MKILQEISLDFARDTLPITVFAKQYDQESRFIKITPLNRGQPYELESGVTARLQVTKADQTQVVNDAAIEGGAINAELTSQVLAAEGIAVAEIGLYKGASLLSSQSFYINVRSSAYDQDKAKSSDEYGSLVDALGAVQGAIDKTDEAAKNANDAAGSVGEAIEKANKAEAAATSAAAAAREAAAAVGDEIDGIVIIDNDSSTKYLGKFRIASGHPALEITKLQ